MVAAVRGGMSMREVAKVFGVSLSTVQLWVSRAGGCSLDEVDWQGRASRPHVQPGRTPRTVEELVLEARRSLREESAHGEYGALSVRASLLETGHTGVPSVRTINRILARNGAFDGNRRERRSAPPRGWYLSDVAARRAELDSFDLVEGLVIAGISEEVQVLTGISLHGGLIMAEPSFGWPTASVLPALLSHWLEYGLPAYAQFDNDTRFQGPHQHRDTVGRVTRMCLQVGVTPVFAPPRSLGFQAAVESLNNRWQMKVWKRFHHQSLHDLRSRSSEYVAAINSRCEERRRQAPARAQLDPTWESQLSATPEGTVVFLRRTNDRGVARVMGHDIPIAPHWANRLVRAEVNLPDGPVRVYALRRREPTAQPLMVEVPYCLPHHLRQMPGRPLHTSAITEK